MRSGLAFICILSAHATAQTFSADVYPILQAANCRGCHMEGGLAGTTRLRFPSAGASADEVENFVRGLTALIDRSAPDQSLLLRKPTNREKHTGGQLIRPGSKEETVLTSWLRLAAAGPTEPVQQRVGAPVSPKLRRLTHSQYNNTVRDLLGDETRPADRFPPEDYVNGFRNQTSSQDVSPLLAEAYNLAAERLAKAAFQGNTDEHKLVPCTPRSPNDEQCRAQFVRSFGTRAFRRPLTQDEQIRYEEVFRKAAHGNGTFYSGAQVVIEAILQSPKFLFQIQGGSQHRAWAVASRLSYFLWDTMPDATLLDSAASGTLLKPAGLKASIDRMLKDPRARQGLDEFVSQWLRFDLVLGAVKDRALFPQFTPELAAAMTEETRLLIHDIVDADRSFMEVFTAGHAFVSNDLARIYSIPAPPSEFAKVALPADSGRAGLIGQALFLALTSKPGETSPTVRGYFVREHFLCQRVPDPPPGTNANLPPLSVSKPQTTRERLSEHTTNATCRGCHSLMDPVGFGLEGFDAIGRRRDKEKLTFVPDRLARGQKTTTVELPLNVSGVLQGISNSPFTSPRELGQLLASSPQCQECIVRQMFRYALGRHEGDQDSSDIDQATAVFHESGFRVTALMAYLGEILARADERN